VSTTVRDRSGRFRDEVREPRVLDTEAERDGEALPVEHNRPAHQPADVIRRSVDLAAVFCEVTGGRSHRMFRYGMSKSVILDKGFA